MAHSNEQADLIAPALLLFASVAGFACANSKFASSYENILVSKILLSAGGSPIIDKSILLLINDGLMAIFFLFIGLELKREILVGELSDFRQALLPIFPAIGGMLIPALVYYSFNPIGEASNGWGVPMATDIAFALGVLAVLGSRVPAPLKVMLAAIAIVDDLGAILVIALFYTAKLDSQSLAMALGCFGFCIAANKLGIVKLSVYLLIGVPLWYFMLKSGVHATIAGVLLATTIPLAPKKISRAKLIGDIYSKAASPLDSPAVFLEKSLVKWIGFVVVPIFAFSNSGVPLNSVEFGSISIGIIAGLVLGKPIGVAGAAYLASVLNLAELPEGTSWRQVIGIGFLSGIGFTMSLFVSSLAFENPVLNNESRLAILIASLIAGSLGVFLLFRPLKAN
ncbi:MAG: Na+/H+ antiporter NhaA [Oligoflexales bacterium]